MSTPSSALMLRRAATRVCNRLNHALGREEIVVLRKDLPAPSDAPPGDLALTVTRHEIGARDVLDVYASLQRRIDPRVVEQRLQTGLKFYSLSLEGRVAASTWLVNPGRRFIDEIGYQLLVEQHHLWIRDVFVAPWTRGRGMFSKLLDTVLRTYHRDTRVLWSDTSSDNPASLKAHKGFGFYEVGAMKVMHIGNVLMFRDPPPARVACVGGYLPERRVLLTGERYRPYRDAHLA